MAVLPVPVPLGLATPVAPAATAAPRYSYASNGSGGVNYFSNGNPITNTQYGAGTGQDYGAIESATRSAFQKSAGTPAVTGATGTTQLTPPPANPNNTNTAPAVVYPDKSNDITEQNAGLAALSGSRDAGIGRVNDSYNTINGDYADERAAADTSHTNESNDNQTDLQSNKQTTFQNAVQGRRGLFGTLASLGALSGDGITLANDAVRRGANEDLATATNTYATNQNGLDTGYNTWKAQDKTRQHSLDQTADNNRAQVMNDYYKNQQSYLNNLSTDYQAEGNTGKAKTYIDQASALFPEINSTNVPALALNYSGGAYTAPTLSSYVGKANNTTVQTTPGSTNGTFNIPGLIAANRKPGA